MPALQSTNTAAVENLARFCEKAAQADAYFEQKAQQLLTHNENLSIRQIGEVVGYHDQAYFSRIFKKYCGVSPAEYRGEEVTDEPV